MRWPHGDHLVGLCASPPPRAPEGHTAMHGTSRHHQRLGPASSADQGKWLVFLMLPTPQLHPLPLPPPPPGRAGGRLRGSAPRRASHPASQLNSYAAPSCCTHTEALLSAVRRSSGYRTSAPHPDSSFKLPVSRAPPILGNCHLAPEAAHPTADTALRQPCMAGGAQPAVRFFLQCWAAGGQQGLGGRQLCAVLRRHGVDRRTALHPELLSY